MTNKTNVFSDNGITGGQLEGSHGEFGRGSLQYLVHIAARSLLGRETYVSQPGLTQGEVESLLRDKGQLEEPASSVACDILSEVSSGKTEDNI